MPKTLTINVGKLNSGRFPFLIFHTVQILYFTYFRLKCMFSMFAYEFRQA